MLMKELPSTQICWSTLADMLTTVGKYSLKLSRFQCASACLCPKLASLQRYMVSNLTRLSSRLSKGPGGSSRQRNSRTATLQTCTHTNKQIQLLMGMYWSTSISQIQQRTTKWVCINNNDPTISLWCYSYGDNLLWLDCSILFCFS